MDPVALTPAPHILMQKLATCKNTEDDFAEIRPDLSDQVDETEPSPDEGHKMAERIWAKVIEQLPIEYQPPHATEDHC